MWFEEQLLNLSGPFSSPVKWDSSSSHLIVICEYFKYVNQWKIFRRGMWHMVLNKY
jgi:hypothetical protein